MALPFDDAGFDAVLMAMTNMLTVLSDRQAATAMPLAYFREVGSGPGVVCLHCNASSPSQWRAADGPAGASPPRAGPGHFMAPGEAPPGRPIDR